MNILLVAATPFEIAGAVQWLEQNGQSVEPGVFLYKHLTIRVLVTGVGPNNTAWELGLSLGASLSDWAINAGVAGAFDRNLSLGEVVHVVQERFGDLGVEEADGSFTDLFELGLLAPDQPPYQKALLRDPDLSQAEFLPRVKGVTVSKVHGSDGSISAIRAKYPEAQVETMEGAAFFYGCLSAGIPFTAIRAISNYVEPRNRAGWRLEEAIGKLNKVLIDLLESLA